MLNQMSGMCCDREQTSQQKFSNYNETFLLSVSVGGVLFYYIYIKTEVFLVRWGPFTERYTKYIIYSSMQ